MIAQPKSGDKIRIDGESHVKVLERLAPIPRVDGRASRCQLCVKCVPRLPWVHELPRCKRSSSSPLGARRSCYFFWPSDSAHCPPWHRLFSSHTNSKIFHVG